MKKIFVIDWTLIPLLVLSAASGIGLHIAGHGTEHEVWHNWAVAHVIASVFLLAATIMHIAKHWDWYKGLIKHGIGNKSLATVVLSAVFLFVVATGIALLGWIEGVNSDTGLWHYVAGIAFTIVATGHIIKRIPILRKSIRK